jgi:hypothetical protein
MKKVLFWLLAVVITLAALVYQRKTGPTYPLSGKIGINGILIEYELPRSAESSEDREISILVPHPDITGTLRFKRFKTDDPWTEEEMKNREGTLAASLPRQPAAGKLAYQITLNSEGKDLLIPGEESVVIRFKDKVPTALLIFHVIVIFGGMLISTRAGIAALDKQTNLRRFVPWAVAFLFLGGFILGPLMQKFAFGAWWTGFPVGKDLTDTKTLLAFIAWLAAWIAGRKGKPAHGWVLAASLITLFVFLIPHSLLGSELDYSKMPR